MPLIERNNRMADIISGKSRFNGQEKQIDSGKVIRLRSPEEEKIHWMNNMSRKNKAAQTKCTGWLSDYGGSGFYSCACSIVFAGRTYIFTVHRASFCQQG